MGSISKNVTYSVLVQVPIQIFGIIAGIFITRMLGPSGRGLYAIFYADVSLFATVLDFSIINSIIYFSASKKTEHSKLMGITLLFTVITMLLSLVLAIGWINTPFADLLFPVETFRWQYILFFILFLLISHINTLYSGFFQGAKMFNIVNKVLLLNSIFNILLFGAAFSLHLAGIVEIKLNEVLVIGLIVLLINTLFWHIYFRKNFTYKFNFSLKWKEDIKPFFNFMGLGHLGIIVNFFNYRLVLWILAYYLDEGEVGIYTLSAGLGQMLYFLSTPLSQVLMPYLSSESSENKMIVFQRFARMHFTFILIIAFVGMAVAPFLIPLLYGANFERSIIPFEILMGGMVLACQTKLFGSLLLSDNKVKLNLAAAVFGLLLSLAFNFTLISDHGIVGAAIAQTITYLGIFLFIYIASIIFTKIGKYNLFIINQADIKYAWSRLRKKS